MLCFAPCKDGKLIGDPTRITMARATTTAVLPLTERKEPGMRKRRSIFAALRGLAIVVLAAEKRLPDPDFVVAFANASETMPNRQALAITF